MRLLFCPALFVGSLLVTGCGSSDAKTPSPGDGTPPTRSGFVGVTSRPSGGATPFSNGVFAGFADGPGNSYPAGCERKVVGTCQILLCGHGDAGARVPPAPGPPVSAGTVTIDGTTPPFTLDYDSGTKQYAPAPAVPDDQAIFEAGATIRIAAKGADVPVFTESLVAPTTIAVTSPELAGGLSIDIAQDLVFVWTGASSGAIAFNIDSTTSGAPNRVSSFVSCQFPASAGKGTIPEALLQELDRTGPETHAKISTDLSSTKEAVVGDYAIHLAVGGLATQADGKSEYGSSQVTIL